jgi:hypothetical protein
MMVVIHHVQPRMMKTLFCVRVAMMMRVGSSSGITQLSTTVGTHGAVTLKLASALLTPALPVDVRLLQMEPNPFVSIDANPVSVDSSIPIYPLISPSTTRVVLFASARQSKAITRFLGMNVILRFGFVCVFVVIESCIVASRRDWCD